MDQNGDQDSPLSIAANIAGLLTFVFAVAATAYARVRYLRSSSTEYLRVKTSLSWYKTESTWLQNLVSTQEGVVVPRMSEENDTDRSSFDEKGIEREEWPRRRRVGLDRPAPPPTAQRAEQHMFEFVMDDLLKLEQRLLDMVNDVESRAADPAAASGGSGISWSLVPGTWHGGRPSVAVAWLGVRTKALELVRQREALTTRVQFLQLSMIASRLQTLEKRVSAAEERERLLNREETMVSSTGVDSTWKSAVNTPPGVVAQSLIR